MANKLSRKGLGMNAQEEEEMDKILKGADMYEHNMSFIQKKNLVAILNESKDIASAEQLEAVEKVSTPSTSKSNVKSSFNKSADQHSSNTGASTSHHVKPPKSDSDDEELKQHDEQRKRWKPNQLRTPQNTYASRVLAASSANKNGTPNKGQVLPADLLAPKKMDNLKISDDKIEELLSDVSSPEQATSKEKNGTKKEESIDDDATQPHPFELQDSDQPANILTAQPIQVSKVRMASMRSKMRKFSGNLQRYRDHVFKELSEVVDFDSGPAYQNLLGKEMERLSISNDRDDWEPPKWGKPISLSTLNGGRRRHQPVKAPSPLENILDDEDAEIIIEKVPSTSNKNTKNAGNSSVATRSAGRDSPYLWNKNDRDVKMDVDEPLLDPFDAIKEEKKEACPICGKLFSADYIENHASNCTDFADVSEDPVEPRPRQTRATAAATKLKAPRSRQNQFDDDFRGNGPHLAAGKTTKNPVMEIEEEESDQDNDKDKDWAEVDNDSDFQPEDSGKKRNNRGQDSGKGKKRRL